MAERLQIETQWILGQADRGENYYSRPDHTKVTSIYGGLFDTDAPSVKGYKELFDMKAVTKAGTTQHLKYLAISFKDTTSGKLGSSTRCSSGASASFRWSELSAAMTQCLPAAAHLAL
jgi:hypothetical protein